MAYPPNIVARAKGLMRAGLGPRLLSRISDIPYETLKEWDQEVNRAAIAADPEALNRLRAYIFDPP